jgi:hypothetical protein
MHIAVFLEPPFLGDRERNDARITSSIPSLITGEVTNLQNNFRQF